MADRRTEGSPPAVAMDVDAVFATMAAGMGDHLGGAEEGLDPVAKS
jgi:hypothetical protein